MSCEHLKGLSENINGHVYLSDMSSKKALLNTSLKSDNVKYNENPQIQSFLQFVQL